MTGSSLFPDLLYSERLRIELFTEADAAFIIALLNSKGCLDGIGDRQVHSTAEALAYIHKINHTENFRYWAVRIKTSEVTTGMISCIKREDLSDFDLGFAFLPEFSGKGYALEAANTVIAALKKNPLFHRLLAFALPANARSLHLLEKLHFRFQSDYESHGDKLSLYVHDTQ